MESAKRKLLTLPESRQERFIPFSNLVTELGVNRDDLSCALKSLSPNEKRLVFVMDCKRVPTHVAYCPTGLRPVEPFGNTVDGPRI
jgi:hypothetical protein